jgi:ribonuclease R
VTPFGVFVQLDQLFVEGLVHITELGAGDYLQYDDARHELRGERTGKRYGLTDRVTVQVARVDLESRKIDLVLAQGAGELSADQVRSRANAPGNGAKGGKGRKAKGGAQQAAPVAAEAVGEVETEIEFVKPPRRARNSNTSNAPAKNSAKKTAVKKAARTESKTSRKKK